MKPPRDYPVLPAPPTRPTKPTFINGEFVRGMECRSTCRKGDCQRCAIAWVPSSSTSSTSCCFPVSLAGYTIWIGKGLLAGRGSGVSGTAQGPLSARVFQHMLGTREDQPASRLMMVLPDVPAAGVRLFAAPLLCAHRLTGYVPKAFRYPFEGEILPQHQASARVTFFDGVVERSLPGLTQFVILGAGFDTRAFRRPVNDAIRSFEVDTSRTQAVKRASLQKAGINPGAVTFVAADFETEDWLGKLVDAGFDPATPALFLWEGVMIYLDAEAVEATLRKIASTARGSIVAFDYITTEPLASGALVLAFGQSRNTGCR